jgi:hypothetical protein
MYTNKDMKRMNAKMNESDGIKKENRNPGRMKLGFVLDNGQKNMSQIHLAQGSYIMIRMFNV